MGALLDCRACSGAVVLRGILVSENMFEILRKIVPRKLLVWVRLFMIYQGEWNHTPGTGKLLRDARGEFVPWITYAAIEFLRVLDFRDAVVFEYGSGSSTHFWAARAKKVFSVERDGAWFAKVRASLPSHCTLVHEGDETKYPERIAEFGQQFDVIVIDGAVRFPCMEAALPFLKSDGVILLDNLEWYPRTAEKLRAAGFFQIDFSGMGPQNAFTSCTSLFFREPSRLARRKEISEWKPVGGRYLLADDDRSLSAMDPGVLVRNG